MYYKIYIQSENQQINIFQLNPRSIQYVIKAIVLQL